MNIKILHLFSRLMSLYGEYGNISILEKQLSDNGHTVTVERSDSLPEDLSGYSLIYIGSGTEEDIIEACRRLSGRKDDMVGSPAQWLITGTAMALLGKTVTYRGWQYDATGIFSFETEMDCEKRRTSDVVTTADNPFGRPVIGYINSSSRYVGLDSDLFTLMQVGQAADGPAKDGIMDGSILATELIGPVLVKNPCMLGWVYQRLTGESLVIDEGDLLQTAYERALGQLTNRIKQ